MAMDGVSSSTSFAPVVANREGDAVARVLMQPQGIHSVLHTREIDQVSELRRLIPGHSVKLPTA